MSRKSKETISKAIMIIATICVVISMKNCTKQEVIILLLLLGLMNGVAFVCIFLPSQDDTWTDNHTTTKTLTKMDIADFIFALFSVVFMILALSIIPLAVAVYLWCTETWLLEGNQCLLSIPYMFSIGLGAMLWSETQNRRG